MTVLTAAWQGAGCPERGSTKLGPCACCATHGALTPIRSVVSKAFTGFQGWADPSGPGLCAACAWGHSTPVLRSAPHLITRNPAALQQLPRHDVGVRLLAGALSTNVAVVVPLRPGRKHLLPAAVWGRVTVDDVHLPWQAGDATRLRIVAELRSLGFGTRMLNSPAPAFHVMSSLPPAQRLHVLQMWDQLRVWRTPDNPWLPLALHITTPTKETL